MGIDGVGSSVVIALAAVLWFLYLVPTWLKRQEYLATERNAVRLQQTMRILAESAEVPSVVRIEATARTVAAQQRALRKHQRNARVNVSFPLPEQSGFGGNSASRSMDPARRLRRSRAFASGVLMAALVSAGFGGFALVADGSWILFAGSVVVSVGALILLGQAAAVTRARAELRRAAIATPTASDIHDHADYAPARRTAWTPVPVPTPLYLSRPTSAVSSAVSQAALARTAERKVNYVAELRAAAAEAERVLREAQASPEVTRIERPAASSTAAVRPSRFASMGVLDSADAAPADLDEILRRRRAVG
ncbi:MAG: hypothetical protein ABI238_06855 [Terrimesophilobacter sp.]